LATFFSTTGMDQQPTEYLFGFYHLIYLLVFIFSFFIIFTLLLKKSRKKQNTFVNFALILILLLKYSVELIFVYEYYQIAEPYSSYPHPFLDINTFFSFQLCGVMNILLPVVIWFNIKPLKFFVYLSSILGGLSVIFYPVTVLYGDPFIFTLPMLRSIIVHFFLIFIPLFLIYQGDIKIEKKKAYQLVVGILLTAVWAMFGNLLINNNANNMYLMSNPFFGGPIPLINALPNGWHVLFLAFAVTIGYTIAFNIAKAFQKLKPRVL